MVIKINYTSSDIYVSTNVSPIYVVVNYSGVSTGGGVWGQITGTLSNQTDLQTALNAKFDDPTGTTSQYLRGDGSLATFPTIPGGTVTSVDMTVPTGLTVSGNPITSAGTLALALASGYSIPTTSSQANWDAAYNDKINSAAVTGTSTKTLTLNQQDGGTVTASWSDIDTGLTSVGLSMPSAFAVANSPLTSNGTLAVTGAGTAAQYVRGDGALATFPSTASGGSSVNYYLNGSVNASVAGYKQLANTAVIGAGTNFNLTGNGLIAQFLTDAGNPNRVEIPGGAWNFEMYFNSSSNGGNEAFYVELLKYNGTTFTSIATTSANPESITGGTSTDLYLTSLAVPTTALLVTDRLAIRVYIVNNSGARTITLHTEDNNLCEILTTFAGGIAALNGLTANTQYLATGTSGTDFNISSLTDTHTFNLPTASATNRGALSSADWSTFSGKVGGSGVAGQVAYWNGTSSQTGSNNFFWDAANSRLGIGTTSPAAKLHVDDGTGAALFVGLASNIYYRAYEHIWQSLNGTFERMRIDPNGKVGIGTTSPATNLHVSIAGSVSGRFSNTTSGVNTEIGVISGLGYVGTQSAANFIIITSDTERARFTTAGRLLLGTTTESTFLLDINGTARVSGAATFSSSVTAGGEGSASSGTINLVSADSFMRINTTGGTADKRKWDMRVISASGLEALEFRTINDANNVFSTKLSITHGGNLLVGTSTNSGERLQVSGSVLATSFIKSGGTSSQYLMADGSVTTGGGGGGVDELQVSLICQVFG